MLTSDRVGLFLKVMCCGAKGQCELDLHKKDRFEEEVSRFDMNFTSTLCTTHMITLPTHPRWLKSHLKRSCKNHNHVNNTVVGNKEFFSICCLETRRRWRSLVTQRWVKWWWCKSFVVCVGAVDVSTS